ncbi:MAG: hypothetical protein RMI34_02890 [Chloroherpetonaceae bacterium]|nr:hypothetical protein [Chloroherpetonaceae bacterium]MCS7210586.1 hypothetical protein [Chloroherpetonaceae bacterium]MDW8019003.1 hypothetical protein [Chloroherpetonaceae bacterium]MDW8465588.1 hypothetical protein [Chloroherpetonaceae bacterium]
MQPTKTLLFLLSVFLLLGILAAIFPEEGIRLGDKLSLRFISLREALGLTDEPQATETAFASALPTSPEASTVLTPTTYRIDYTDSTRLIYPNDDKSVLYPLFAALERAQQESSLVRILHYGDSQIEEDRMTHTIRASLQKVFGGSGVGLLSAKPLANSLSISHSWSDNWARYAAFGDSSKPTHNRFGIMAAYCDYQNDRAMLSFKRKNTSPAQLGIEKVGVLYGNAKSPAKLTLSTRTGRVGEKPLQKNRRLSKVEWLLAEPEEALSLQFIGHSPEVYGILLDGKCGVAVDNLPIRGSSGIEFTKGDSALFAESVQLLNAKAVIFQFGGNTVPAIKDQKDLEWYEVQLTKQFRFLTSLGLQLIVIGPADMSTKVKDRYVTYPFLPEVREMMMRTTHRFGGVYWDMYAAMGGKNSMPKWVKQKLAIEDYTHFTRQGAQKIAEMFVQSFLSDYRQYQDAKLRSLHSTTKRSNAHKKSL